jgi:hypothetical protein
MGQKNVVTTVVQTPDERKLSTTCSHTTDNTHTSGFVLIYEMKFVVILVHENRVSSQVQAFTLLIAFIL